MIKCYTDASFDPKFNTAVIGWRVNNHDLRMNILKNTTNIRAELMSLIKLLSGLNANKNYIVYTDCQSIINRVASKDELIKKNFMTNKGEELFNADLYKKLFELLTPNIKLIHIDGHLPVGQRNDDDREFSDLDKAVRKKLREIVKENLQNNELQ